MKKHYGFHFIELLVVMAILPVVILVTTQMFRVFALEIPRGQRVVQEQNVLLHLLGQLRTDIQSSLAIRVNEDVENHPLTIQGQHQTWIYQSQSGDVIRAESVGDPNAQQWRLPRTHIQWSLVEPHPGIMALQVESGIEDDQQGRSRTHLALTHLFFVPHVKSGEVYP